MAISVNELIHTKIPAISHWNFCFRVPILGYPFHDFFRVNFVLLFQQSLF